MRTAPSGSPDAAAPSMRICLTTPVSLSQTFTVTLALAAAEGTRLTKLSPSTVPEIPRCGLLSNYWLSISVGPSIALMTLLMSLGWTSSW